MRKQYVARYKVLVATMPAFHGYRWVMNDRTQAFSDEKTAYEFMEKVNQAYDILGMGSKLNCVVTEYENKKP